MRIQRFRQTTNYISVILNEKTLKIGDSLYLSPRKSKKGELENIEKLIKEKTDRRKEKFIKKEKKYEIMERIIA